MRGNWGRGPDRIWPHIARQVAREMARSARRGRWRPGPSIAAPIAGVIVVLGLVALGVGLLAALLSSPVFLLTCAAPAVIIAALAIAAIHNRSSKSAPAEQSTAQAAERWDSTPSATGLLIERMGQAIDKSASLPQATPERVQPPAATSGSDFLTSLFGGAAAKRAPAVPALQGPKPAYVPEKGLRPPAEYLKRATSYRKSIQSLLNKRRKGPLYARLTEMLDKLDGWAERVGQLVDRLVSFENDSLIQRDVKEVPRRIAGLRRQRDLEAEPRMREQIERTLSAYEEQQRHLEALALVMRRTRLNLDDTLAAMGTVYSQVQMLNAMDLDGPRAAQITSDIDREVGRLNDLMEAMGEVYEDPGRRARLDEASKAEDDLTAQAEAARRMRLSGPARGE